MKHLLLTLTCLAACSPLAHATSISLSGFDNSRSAMVVWPYFGGGSYQVGAMVGTVDGIDRSPLFCVDFFTFISFNVVYDTFPIAPRELRNEDRVMWLYVNHLASTPDEGVAMQFAFWDIVHDDGDGLSAGSISNSLATLSLAQQNLVADYLAISAGQSQIVGASIYSNFDAGNGAPAQNLIGGLHTPEPASVVLSGFGLAALALAAKRRKRSESGCAG